MKKVKISFKVSPVNINNVFKKDFILVKNVGREFHESSFDFKRNLRMLVYKCKSKRLFYKTIDGAKLTKSKIKSLVWRTYVV